MGRGKRRRGGRRGGRRDRGGLDGVPIMADPTCCHSPIRAPASPLIETDSVAKFSKASSQRTVTWKGPEHRSSPGPATSGRGAARTSQVCFRDLPVLPAASMASTCINEGSEDSQSRDLVLPMEAGGQWGAAVAIAEVRGTGSTRPQPNPLCCYHMSLYWFCRWWW